MKNYFPPIAILLALIAVAVTLRSPRNSDEYDVVAFGRLPTLVNGRVKPLDTVARTSLLVMQGSQAVRTFEGRSLAPAEWLLDALYRPEVANTYPVFEIVHPEVLALLDLTPDKGAGGKRFSIEQLAGHVAELDRQARLAADVEAALQTSFQRAVLQLRNRIGLYQQLQESLMPFGDEHFFERVGKLPAAVQAGAAREPESAKLVKELANEFSTMDTEGALRPVPPDSAMGNVAGWKTQGGALGDVVTTGKFNAAALTFVEAGRAWQDRQPETFNRAVRDYRTRLDAGAPELLKKSDVEARFNSAQPFYTSLILYVLAFGGAVLSWLKWPKFFAGGAFGFIVVAFLLSTAGIATRMWLEARPPVTNLYSSALFVGWAAVAVCLALEYIYKNGIGSAVAGLAGFASLVVAQNLSTGGDTLEMMRAVLDNNFWLATHVVTIAVGYAATFIAGFLAIVFVFRGVLTRSLDKATADSIQRMIYGVVCFATLFSLVGTVLGGIWADQSWGRFWGWDPKENGALILVLWNSIILHARWGGLVKQRGLAILAIGGNVVTGWSWFGVNMLGVGLHSYGFTDAAFWGLIMFAVTNLAFIGLGLVPLANWRSFPLWAGAPATQKQRGATAAAGAGSR